MKPNKMLVEIISINTSPVREEVLSVSLPTYNGLITILPRHTPLVVKLEIGIVKTSSMNNTKQYAILGGLAHIEKSTVTIFTKLYIEGNKLPIQEESKLDALIGKIPTKLHEEELMRLYLIKTIKNWREKYHFNEMKFHE